MSQKRTPKAKIEQPEVLIPQTPPTLDEIILDLKGFGVEATAEPVVITASGRTVALKLSNIPTEEELETLLATEDYKGHAWIARVKGEILSRAISSINGTDLSTAKDEYVVDPVSGEETLFRVALRNMIMGWGQEVVNVLWKVMMVHCQRIEDRLFESLPDAQVMTEVEKRFISQAMQEIQEAQQEVYREAAKDILLGDDHKGT